MNMTDEMMDQEFDEPEELEETEAIEEPEEEEESYAPLQSDPGDEQDDEHLQEAPQPEPDSTVVAQMAQQGVQAKIDRFVKQFGYEPSDEVVFGWQVEEESRIVARQQDVGRQIAQLERNQARLESEFVSKGLPKGTAKEFVAIVKRYGEDGLNPAFQEEILDMAVGRAVRNGKTTPQKPSGETTRGAAPVGGMSNEDKEAIKEMRQSNKKPANGKSFTRAEIERWKRL